MSLNSGCSKAVLKRVVSSSLNRTSDDASARCAWSSIACRVFASMPLHAPDIVSSLGTTILCYAMKY